MKLEDAWAAENPLIRRRLSSGAAERIFRFVPVFLGKAALSKKRKRTIKMLIQRLNAITALLIMLLSAGQGIASDTLIHHEYSNPAITWIEYRGQREKLNNDPKPTLVIPQGATTHIFVENPNPFLFLYSATDVQLVDMPDVAELEEFGEALSGMLGQFDAVISDRKGTLHAPICEIYYDDQSIGNAMETVRTAIQIYVDLPQRIDRTLRNEQIDSTRLQVDPETIKELKAVNAGLEAARAELFRTNDIDLSVVVSEAVPNGSVRTSRTTFDLNWSELDNPDFAEHCTGSDSENIDALHTAWHAFWELRVDLERWRDIAKTFERFNVDALAFEERVALKDMEGKQVKFVSTWSKKVEANVELKYNPFWSALLSNKAKEVRAELVGAGNTSAVASHPIVLEPERFAHFAISPGLVYSFVDQSSFSAEGDGAGGFTIQDTQDDSGEIDAAVALNIYPDRLYKQEIKPFLQVGVAPGDHTAFLLGVGARFGDSITLAIGAAYQEVAELSGGQKVGDTINSEDALSVGDGYDTGLYVNLSYDIELF